MTAPGHRDGVEITVGYRGLGTQPDRLEQRTVAPAAGDAPPWDANTPLRAVGSDHDRVDGLAKASGRAKYTSDVTFPGLLQARILRSPVARGTLTTLELDAARALPGIAAVIALKQPGQRVRFVGDAIAAVAGTDLHRVRDALEAIRADYAAEPHTVDYLQHEDAPALAADGSIADAWPSSASVEQALAAAAQTHEATYRTEVQTHSSLESHGAVAKWNGDDLEVWCSTQATFGVRGELARALRGQRIDVGTLTVHAEFVGGGFGSKFGAGIEGLACCLLAREAKAPVKLMLDRFEEHTTTGNRPAALLQLRAGVDADGKLTAWDVRSFGGCGFNVEKGEGGGNVAVPDYYTKGAKTRRKHLDLATDTDPARPMRAPGYPQGWFGAELFLDELAAKAGIDPLEFRLRNDRDTMRLDQWRFGAERFGWAEARARRNEPGARLVRGVGLASARWGQLGNPGRQPHGIQCRIHQDGSVEVRSGAQDIGTGLKTVMVLITADELAIPPARVTAVTGHTGDPSGPGSGGSTTTPSLAPAVRHAAFLARQELAALLAKDLGADAAQVAFGDGTVTVGGRALSWADACKRIGPNPIDVRGKRFPNYDSEPFSAVVCGCQFAEVEVDTWTGLVRVVRMFGVQDCGLVIAKKLAESQVLGAMLQGISYALHEQRILDRTTGRMLNGDFLRYKILGSEDVPELGCHLMTVHNGHTSTPAAGLGEPPSVAAPAAVANAVFHALGAPVRHLPITPDKVLAALAARRQ
ncbi:MAG: xanthine dehydrogenase family protein molybdopterin-binding subunit [Planctomycetes bacterium]|nr:xanthine dehydrogenase family protein molybdopterin-binding subunit [Planctomycetota bacterium]